MIRFAQCSPYFSVVRRICAFCGTPLPLKGGGSEKSRGCCSTMRAPWLRTGCIFCCTSDAALALSIPPKVRSQNAKKVV